MNTIYDLEAMTRISLRTANPRMFLAFKTSIQLLPFTIQLLGEFHSDELTGDQGWNR